MSIELVYHDPVSSSTSPAFVDWQDDSQPYGLGGGVRMVTTPVYERSAEGESFRQWRLIRRLTLSGVAKAAGISVADASGLEYGRCSPKCGWERLREVVG